MTGALVKLLVAVAVLIIAWFINDRFSPDPLITKIVQIIIFIAAIILVLTVLLPLAGLNLGG